MLERRKVCKVGWVVVSVVAVGSVLGWTASGGGWATVAPRPTPPTNTSSSSGGVRRLPSHDPSTLINLTDFEFLSKGRCNGSGELLILVVSSPLNAANRLAIRDTWGRGENLVFLLGRPGCTALESALQAEIRTHGDIVQGNFVDAYRNLTYKHVMGLKWVAYHCPAVKYILKIDDDVFVNLPSLRVFLRGGESLSPPPRRLIMCNVIPRSLAKRTYRSKWRVSPAEYPSRWYPDYCAGWVVLYSPDVALTLYSEAQEAPFFWIDDIHITGVLASKANLSRTSIHESLSIEDYHTPLDSIKKKLNYLFLLSKPHFFYDVWRAVKSSEPS